MQEKNIYIICSVVIPTYNRKDKVLEAVNSVLDQDIKNIEVIVVDDGSTDGTASYLRSHNLPITIVEKENGGVSSARNAGIKVSRGVFVAFLDSDDLWLPGMLHEALSYFNSHPNIFALYTDQYINIDGKNLDQTRFERNAPQKKLSLPAFVDFTPIHTSTVFIKREVFDVVGMFDERLSVHEDSELWNRISDQYDFGFISKPLGVYRWESSADHITSERNQIKFLTNGRIYLQLYKEGKKRLLTDAEMNACIESEKIISEMESKLNK